MTKTYRGLSIAAAAAIGIGSASGAVTQLKEVHKAEAVLRAPDGTRVGTVEFRRRGTGTQVDVNIKVTGGLTAMDAFHGFHVHANDDPANGTGCTADPAQPSSTWFVSADGHLSEPGTSHGGHAGDMPSVLVNADGSSSLEFVDARLSAGALEGRAVVLHAGSDNFGNVPADQYAPTDPGALEKTAKTGNAGDRIACGVIVKR